MPLHTLSHIFFHLRLDLFIFSHKPFLPSCPPSGIRACTKMYYLSLWIWLIFLKIMIPNTIYFSCKWHHFILYGQIKFHCVYAPHFLYLVSCRQTPQLTDFPSRQNSSHLITKMRLLRTCILQETVTNEEDAYNACIGSHHITKGSTNGG